MKRFDRRARAGERLNVVFFGASLTWGANATDPQLTSYRALVGRRLEEEYPEARFRFWDAAIGGTGSQLGAFRLERDVLRREPDLVFLDFSANDDITAADPERLASYESLVRRLVGAGVPVVQVIFPFKQDAAALDLSLMPLRDAHYAISRAYGTGIGDAIELIQGRIQNGLAEVDRLWPFDGGHPCDLGYDLFAEAALNGYRRGLDKARCFPTIMLHADTYMTTARVRLSTLAPLPPGWRVGIPNHSAAFFDMLMSRWLDDEVVATDSTPFQARFRGSMALLFGESTPKSCRFRVLVDGDCQEIDAGWIGVPAGGNGHQSFVVAQNLDPDFEHTIEIVPLIQPGSGQELRLESLCLAGRNAAVM